MRAAIASVLVALTCACPAPSANTCNADADCGQGLVCAGGVCSEADEGEGEGDGCAPIADAVSVALVTSSDGPACAGVVMVTNEDGSAPRPLALNTGSCHFVGPAAATTGRVRVVASLFNHEDTVRVVDVCGSTFELTLTLERAPETCAVDRQCANGLCMVDGAVGHCGEATAGGAPPGTLCAADSACDHGTCLDGLCTALCDENAGVCSSAQICTASDALVGAQVCVLDPDLPRVPCEDSSACAGTGRKCNDLDAGELVCGLPRGGTSSPGDACDDGLESDTCVTGLCDAAQDGVCVITCADDATCSEAIGGSICSTDPDFGVTLCADPCTRADDCATRTCRARADAGRDETVFVCDVPRGALEPGVALEVGEDASDCTTNFAVDTGSVTLCSVACVGDGDCRGGVPTCGNIEITRPAGGAQTVRACGTN